MSTAQTTVGSEITATINGQGMIDMNGYEIIVAYDTDKLEFIQGRDASGAFSAPIAPITSPLTFVAAKTGAAKGDSGDVALAVLTFKAKQQGTAAITLNSVRAAKDETQEVSWKGAVSASINVVVPSGSSSRGSSGSSAPAPAPTTTDTVKMDAALEAKTTKETTADGQAVTLVTVDADKLTKAFATNEHTRIVSLNVKSTDPVVKVEIPVSALQEAASKQANTIVQVQLGDITYSLPASISKNLPKDTVVTLTISKVSGKTGEEVKSAAQKSGAQLLANPVDFTVSNNGKNVTDFNGLYVDRVITLSTSLDPNKVTAVWIDSNNNMYFVPSVITNNNGSSDVTIRSPHNSIYTVIQADKTFADMQSHWAKTDVELLANKLIVNGVKDNQFAPDQQITRAEFAALLVRSLGLVEVKENAFKDVKATDWFVGAVGAAQKAGLVSGYEDGTFKPNANITREQMVTMIVRALKAGGKEVNAAPTALDSFNDRAVIADWAQGAAAQSLTAGIVQGTTASTFSAKDNATRAQSATMLKRMLQYLQFIN
jgi:hypothetical protein